MSANLTCLLCGAGLGPVVVGDEPHAEGCPFQGATLVDHDLIRRVADELDPVVIQRDDLAERLDRIRALAESDADLANLPAVRDFLLTETPRALDGGSAVIHVTDDMVERFRATGSHHAA